MSNHLRFALLACALSACNAGGSGTKSHIGGPDGSGGSSGTGGPPLIVGGGDGPVLITPGTGGGAPKDTDPGNPNITHALCGAGQCLDFPENPVMGEGVPTNVADLFGAPDNFTAGGLCALEPQLSVGDKPGAMIPANWTRPRFRVMAPAGIDVLEIRIHSA